MLERARRFAIRLHRDESGPNTVEWVLLIIVALIILVGIYYFVTNVVMKSFTEAQEEIQQSQEDLRNQNP